VKIVLAFLYDSSDSLFCSEAKSRNRTLKEKLIMKTNKSSVECAIRNLAAVREGKASPMTFTKQQLLKFNPCHDGLAFATSCDFDFNKIYETCKRGDWLIWLLSKTNAITKPQAVLLTCECAEHVLGICEKKHPNEKRPRQAIDAAREWANNPTEENRATCRAAAAAAYAAAFAAAAAYAAAHAAAYAARTLERKWQAAKIREIIPNPFTR
jgi:hypothetical protein